MWIQKGGKFGTVISFSCYHQELEPDNKLTGAGPCLAVAMTESKIIRA